VALRLSLDGRAIAFASGATLVTGLFFGIVPAWQAIKVSVADTLRSGGRSATTGAGFRSVLAALEIAVAVMLVTGSGLLLRTLASLNSVETGFHADNVLTMRLNSSYANIDPRVAPFLRRVEQAVAAVPGVRSVGVGINLPLDGWDIGMPFEVASQPVEQSKRPSSHYQVVSPGWFDTLGIPVIAGRAFSDRDTPQSTQVCMVNEEIVRQFFHGANPIGAKIHVPPLSLSLADMEREIVGVVKQVKVEGLGEKAKVMEIYVPYAQDRYSQPMLAVQVSGNPLNALPAVKEAIASVDKNVPLTRIRTMEEVASQTVTQPRFRATLVSAFAGLALVLAAVGVFGVLAFSVSQRTREFGIRMALGARSREILALVLRRGLAIAGSGVAAGLAGAIALTRFLETLLFGVTALDPVTFLGSIAVLLLVALAACAAPAIRAGRTNPAVALRSE
jgi:putative ABC transport system permease protein